MLLFLMKSTATTEIYTLALHDALPISVTDGSVGFHGSASSVKVALDTTGHYGVAVHGLAASVVGVSTVQLAVGRSEAHTSQPQSPVHPVCRLLLETKNYQSSTTPPASTPRSFNPSA